MNYKGYIKWYIIRMEEKLAIEEDVRYVKNKIPVFPIAILGEHQYNFAFISYVRGKCYGRQSTSGGDCLP